MISTLSFSVSGSEYNLRMIKNKPEEVLTITSHIIIPEYVHIFFNIPDNIILEM